MDPILLVLIIVLLLLLAAGYGWTSGAPAPPYAAPWSLVLLILIVLLVLAVTGHLGPGRRLFGCP